MIGINVRRWEAKVRAAILAKGENPIPNLAEQLLATFVVENDRPEWGFIAQEFRWMVTELITAGGAGTSAIHALVNPAGSGVIGVVEDTSHLNTAEVTFTTEASVLSTFTAGVTAQPRDLRQRTAAGGAQLSALKSYTRNNAAAFGSRGWRLQANAFSGKPYPLIISEGMAAVWQTTTSNTANEMSVSWRERPQEGGLGS